jgi:hypothetical protein
LLWALPKVIFFFGNQYTNGGYIRDSYTYDVIDKGVNPLKTISNEIGKDTTRIVTKKKATKPKLWTNYNY